MKLHFYKYQGTGNDFILFDNREKNIALSNQQVAFLCDRRFGIGADGLILIELKAGYDFEMVYYNSDGNTSSMCGNGGRCISAFAAKLNVIKDKAFFWAADGEHTANIDQKTGIVSLKMNDVTALEEVDNALYLNTGSPHYVVFEKNIDQIRIKESAHKIRYSDRFKEKGTNVNFVELVNGELKGRTYERGVEDETLSCGTGVTAMAIAAHYKKLIASNSTKINTPGGQLKVDFVFDPIKKEYHSIYLTGPAELIFEGEISI